MKTRKNISELNKISIVELNLKQLVQINGGTGQELEGNTKLTSSAGCNTLETITTTTATIDTIKTKK